MFYGDFSQGKGKEFQQFLKKLQVMFGRVYAQDNLITLQRTVGFLQDKKFNDAFNQYVNTAQEKSLAWRLHTLTWAAKICRDIPGDFVECGVYHGFSLAVVAAYIDFENVDKTLYLYDTFEGIPEEYNSENRSNAVYQKEIAEDKDAIYKQVQQKFAKYHNVKIVRGFVPNTFQEACPERIAFLHLDMNSSKSEIAALEVLFDKVTPGGMIVFDDYGWSGYVKQKIAEDAFMQERGHDILELPTGQGLLIKK
ncbi:MAG: TylF/MycF/NovP-related O-methyltransferase [Calothrix sp. MO_167.B12]|nr:TylF/MycF/NovP-related O-methyltransferase [Calothrix sp. MO_167.B12]